MESTLHPKTKNRKKQNKKLAFQKILFQNEKGKQGQYLKDIDLTKGFYIEYIKELLQLNKKDSPS